MVMSLLSAVTGMLRVITSLPDGGSGEFEAVTNGMEDAGAKLLKIRAFSP